MPYTGLIGFDTQNDANDFNDRAIVNGLRLRATCIADLLSRMRYRVVKDFTLKGEGHHLDLFMDVFNVTDTSNRNFGPQQISLFRRLAKPRFSARPGIVCGRDDTVGGPREFQFTARLVGF